MKKYSADAAPSGITQEYREPKRKKRKKGTDPAQAGGDATIRIIDTDVSGFGSKPRLPPTSFSDDDEPEDEECELISSR